jgi:hypothetical protein
MLQELDFSQRPLCQNLLAENIRHLFDSHTSSSLDIGCCALSCQPLSTALPSNIPDNTICTLAKLFGHIVLLIDDEFLIEHLENLPSFEIGSGHCGKYRFTRDA